MHELSPAARLSAWGTAALEGAVSLDVAADVIAGPGAVAQRFFRLPGEDTAVNLAYALGRLRADGATGLRLVLPRPGDVGELPGPIAFNELALTRGEAVLTVGGSPRAVLSDARGVWTVHEVWADERTPLSLRDAEWTLNQQMREATAVLMKLDVAKWEPVAADVLAHQSNNAGPPALPLSCPAQAHHVLQIALRTLTIVELARQTDGAAVTSGEADVRRKALRDLDTAARRGLEAACSARVR